MHKKTVLIVFEYLDDFLDMMIGIDEYPEFEKEINKYIKIKRFGSEKERKEAYANLFIKYVKLCRKKKS